MELAGKSVLVVGLGKSGLAAAGLLSERGARVLATDSKPLDELAGARAQLEALGAPFAPQNDAVFRGADLIVLSPGVPADLEPLAAARRRGVQVIGEVELAGWFLEGDIIGVTGANGKTTTTALTGHILKQSGVPVQVGGNIGTPPAALVRASRAGQWNVLELSSFQLETIGRFHARVGAVLNVTPDHLDRHGTFEAYAAAKGRLFENQGRDDFAVLNADDATASGYAARARGQVLWFSSSRRVARGAWIEGGRILLEGAPLMPACEVPLRGRHNLENVMAAALCAGLAGAPPGAIADAVRSFPGVEHRLEFVRTVAGVDYYNDSKATNVDATLKALDAFQGGVWIILGGKDKGSDYAPLAAPLAAKARAVLLVGAAAPKIAREVAGAARLIDCGTIETAVEAARRQARPGDTVLLAPACASFDQFADFEHRGRVFKELVARLEERG